MILRFDTNSCQMINPECTVGDKREYWQGKIRDIEITERL